jgi:hypothetical protein
MNRRGCNGPAPYTMGADMANEKLVEAVIMRDFWDNDEVRHCAGAVVRVTQERLIEGMETGILARPKKKDDQNVE